MPDLGSASFSQTDGSNDPAGSAAPNTIDNNIRETKGALTREWNWRSYTVTAGGTADAKTLTYSVAPAAYYNGQRFAFIANTTNTGTCTLNVNGIGAKTIKRVVAGTLTALSASEMVAGMRVEVAYNTADDSFTWVNYAPPTYTPSSATTSAEGVVELATTTEVLTGTDTSRAVTADALAALWEDGGNVASAGTISLGEGGYFNITGTTTITDIDLGTDKAGRVVWVKFAGALTLTHNASTLILPGGANITTAAGDVACFVSEGSDAVRCTSYTKASGEPVVAPAAGGLTLLGTINTASGASANLGTLTLTSYKQVQLVFQGFSSASAVKLQLGTSTSDDVIVSGNLTAATAYSGIVTIDLTNGHCGGTLGLLGESVGVAGDTTITTAATAISVAMESGNLDAGSILVYGVK